MTDFYEMTIPQIKVYAEENNIDINGIRTKAEMIAKISGFNATVSTGYEKGDNVIESRSIQLEQRKPMPSTINSEDNVISSRAAERSFQKIERNESKVDNKVALYSTKNIHWIGIGHISKGYNIVTKEDAEKWLTRTGIRKASPQEVATYYGK